MTKIEIFIHEKFYFYRKDPESIRIRPVLGWAAADYVYVI
jgi:hypothetical protein